LLACLLLLLRCFLARADWRDDVSHHCCLLAAAAAAAAAAFPGLTGEKMCVITACLLACLLAAAAALLPCPG
jgi:hypothetical protein